MSTYCISNDLKLDNGQDLDSYLDVSMTDLQKINLKQQVRQRVFEFINDRFLYGKTAIPALHIPALKNIEKDLVIADILSASFTGNTSNTSEWEGAYRERAMDALENIRFISSVDDILPDTLNTGDGKVGEVVTNDEFTMTELWTLEATNSTFFDVHGSLHGSIRQLEVGEKYPGKSWTGIVGDYGLDLTYGLRYEEYPISLTIESGSVDFVDGDRFIFKTYSASFYRQRIGSILRG